MQEFSARIFSESRLLLRFSAVGHLLPRLFGGLSGFGTVFFGKIQSVFWGFAS